MNESQLQHKIIKFLECHGYWVCKVIRANKSGVPDIICCEPKTGLFVGLEVKRPDGKGRVSELQLYQMRKIHETGGRAYIVESLEDVKMILGLT